MRTQMMVRSAFAEHAVNVSDKYSFIPTTRVLDVLEQRGWSPVKSSESRTRIEALRGFQKHMIRLRQNDTALAVRNVGDVLPEIVVVNSHSGSASFKFMVGLFRLVCMNGMVVSDAMLGQMRVRHVGFTQTQVFDAIDNIMEGIPRVQARIAEFNDIELTPNEQGVYAAAAAQLRWDDTSKVDLHQLVQPKRFEDESPTLWNTFNRVQENIVQGGRVMFASARNGRRPAYRRNKAVAVTGIDQNIKLNKALWTLTEEMARIKGANIPTVRA